MAEAQPVPPAQPAVVTLPEEIDMANASQVGQQLGAALAPGVTVVIADMTPTRFCDSSCIQALVLAHRQAAAHNAELRLVVPPAAVLRVMTITKVDTVLRTYPSLDAARDLNP